MEKWKKASIIITWSESPSIFMKILNIMIASVSYCEVFYRRNVLKLRETIIFQKLYYAGGF